MDYRQLGRTDLKVSAMCLGTFAQIQRAKGRLSLYSRFSRHDLNPAQMALAFVTRQPFVARVCSRFVAAATGAQQT